MSINVSKITLKHCWCSETRSKVFKKGVWTAPDLEVDFQINSCKACGTLRLVSSSRGDTVDYEDMHVYSQALSQRHLNSIKIIKKFQNEGSMLDIGSSAGDMLKELKRLTPSLDVMGIDTNFRAAEVAKENGIEVKVQTLNQIEGSFDNILSSHSLEHIADLESFFFDIKRISHKGTRLHLFVPNTKCLRAFVNIYKWGPLNPVQHCWHFDKKSLAKVIAHFLPNAKIIYMGDSWIWPVRVPFGSLVEKIFSGDQIDCVIEL